MQKYNLNCIPYEHEKLNEWRNAFKGIQWHDKETNFLFFGGIDDVWINDKEELHIVDYKATAKKTFNPNFDTGWEVCYKSKLKYINGCLKMVLKFQILAILFMRMANLMKKNLIKICHLKNTYFLWYVIRIGLMK